MDSEGDKNQEIRIKKQETRLKIKKMHDCMDEHSAKRGEKEVGVRQ
jgi:hypothetical protein